MISFHALYHLTPNGLDKSLKKYASLSCYLAASPEDELRGKNQTLHSCGVCHCSPLGRWFCRFRWCQQVPGRFRTSVLASGEAWRSWPSTGGSSQPRGCWISSSMVTLHVNFMSSYFPQLTVSWRKLYKRPTVFLIWNAVSHKNVNW